LSRPGSAGTILGNGGLIDAAAGIVTDLSAGNLAGVVGAIQKAGTAYQTFKGKDLQSILKTESRNVTRNVIKQELPGAARGVLFPKQPVNQTSAAAPPASPTPVTTGTTATTSPPTINSQTNTGKS
jgi:hypothetical protein